MVAACRYQGMSAQEAFDHLGGMLEVREAKFENATATLPSWGVEVDAEVARYVQGLRDCVTANLHFSFRSERYFGTKNHEVKRSGKVSVLIKPAYLEKERQKAGATPQ